MAERKNENSSRRTKMNLKKIFPNANIGNNIMGACYVKDYFGNYMGWTDYETFFLYKNYENAQEAYERLLSYDVKIEITDTTESLYGEP